MTYGTLWSQPCGQLGLDWTKLPKKRDPSYRHPVIPSIDQNMDRSSEPTMKSRRISLTTTKEASFDDLGDGPQDGYWSAQEDGQSCSSTPVVCDLARDILAEVVVYPHRGSWLRAASTRELASSSMNIAAQMVEAARCLGELACQYVASLASLSCLQKVPPRLPEQPSRLCFRGRVWRRNE